MTARSAPRLTVVVPTLDEAHGIEALLEELLAVTVPLGAEVLVVDDRSGDGTADLARAALARAVPAGAPPAGDVFVRAGPRSLGRSVVEGWQRARGRVLGVIDADLSHPPGLIPRLLAEVEEGGADVAFATRYMPGGGTEGWPLPRRAASRLASLLARTLVRARDPLSGFFLLRREVIDGVALDPRGWKIGLEVLVRGRYDRVAELPFVFRDRFRGTSKFGPRAALDFLGHLARLQAYRLGRGDVRRR